MKSKNTGSKKNKSSSVSVPFLFGETNPSQFNISLTEKIIGSWEIEPKIKKCMICWKKFSKKDKISRCTSCNNRFHEIHWKEWISAKKSCPVCQAKQKL